jgi:formyltetrahydrofolate synthetase
VAVVVATTQALKHHGGDSLGGVEALERGAANLAAHIGIVRRFGVEAIVAVNRFPGDEPQEIETVRQLALERGASAAEINDGYEQGGEGAVALAEAVVEAASRPATVDFLYSLDDSIEDKIAAIATQAYGAAAVELLPDAQAAAYRLTAAGLGRLPVCMAKTHLSLSHDPLLIGAPIGFTLPVRELRPYTGAGWIVALCGDMQTMPGLPAAPAAHRIDVDPGGAITGLR